MENSKQITVCRRINFESFFMPPANRKRFSSKWLAALNLSQGGVYKGKACSDFFLCFPDSTTLNCVCWNNKFSDGAVYRAFLRTQMADRVSRRGCSIAAYSTSYKRFNFCEVRSLEWVSQNGLSGGWQTLMVTFVSYRDSNSSVPLIKTCFNSSQVCASDVVDERRRQGTCEQIFMSYADRDVKVHEKLASTSWVKVAAARNIF